MQQREWTPAAITDLASAVGTLAEFDVVSVSLVRPGIPEINLCWQEFVRLVERLGITPEVTPKPLYGYYEAAIRFDGFRVMAMVTPERLPLIGYEAAPVQSPVRRIATGG